MPNSYSNTEFNKPFNDLTKYMPTALQNEMNTSLLDNLFNRFMSHDESVPLYGYVGKKPALIDDKTSAIPQPNVEREVNSLTPVISFKTGQTDHLFTVQDLKQKAKVMGVTEEGDGWFYTQSNNFVPPISLDKFVNFFNYFWTGNIKETKPNLAWNPTLAPEYYVIAQPENGDVNKMNARVATTENIIRTGSGFNKIQFKIKFSSPTQFTMRAIGSLGLWTPVFSGTYTLTSNDQTFSYTVTNGSQNKNLITFNITRDVIYDQNGDPAGYASFDANDEFTIDCTFLTRNYTVNFKGTAGVKGKITKFQSLNEYQTIDGVVVQPGDRVLVKNAPTAEAGIYIVSPDTWEAAPDFAGVYKAAGARVWVREGVTNSNTMFVSFAAPGGFGWKADPTIKASNTNQWQEGNFWMSSEELAASGIIRTDAIQATRPIIEYAGSLQLNEFVDSVGNPSDSGKYFRQEKTTFDQLPLFDLYRYDGTHAGLVSSVFYYEESMTNPLDIQLQKRVNKTHNESQDFTFNHGMFDDVTGQLLFAKQNGKITSVWQAGYTKPTVSDVYFNGPEAVNPKLTNIKVENDHTAQQKWVVSAISPTEFTVTGSVNGKAPNATVGAAYNNREISFKITGTFIGGETFVFSVGNLERPNYVTIDEEGNRRIPFGGKEYATEKGAYEISRTFIHNPYLDSRHTMTEGVVNSHFRSILEAQIPGSEIDYALGGEIKLWGEQHTLMASQLMQRDMTPISIIDLSERMYASALTSIRDIYQQNIAVFISKMGSVRSLDDVDTLLDQILEIHAKSEMAKTVLYDTTSPVVGFPATLPQMACAPLVKPTIRFSPDLGIQVIVHHDGHESELFEDTDDFRRTVLGNFIDKTIIREDGTSTSVIGSFTDTPPENPYKGELWKLPSGMLYSFAVDYDGHKAPVMPASGALWFNRSTRVLYKYNGNEWVTTPVNTAWTPVNLANILNLLILNVETRLYKGININARKIDFDALEEIPEYAELIKDELYTFSALNGYDPVGADYVASDAFTWNYSKAVKSNFAPIKASTVPARWFDIIKSHHETVAGVIPTAQPHNEPWKLFGFEDSQVWWDSLTDAKRDAYTPVFQMDQLPHLTFVTTVDAVSHTRKAHPMSGLITVDNVELKAGDKLLVVDDIAPMNNGVWIISANGWNRFASSMDAGSFVKVTSGAVYHDTFWGLANTVTALNIPFSFGQIRMWTNQLWADVKAKRPTLKLSVNTVHDALLPPYVNAQADFANEALTKVMPGGASLPYQYGQNSPVENIWKHTAEYLYSRVRALFRYDPLMFYGLAWGFNWVDVNGILYDGFDISMPGHKRFRLHGDAVSLISTRAGFKLTGNKSAMVITYNAYDSNRKQNFMVSDLSGEVLGYVQEGVSSVVNGSTIKIEDGGIPYRIGDRFEVDATGNAVFIPVGSNRIMGYGQIFTNALRDYSIDTNTSYAVSAFREWDVRMGYRAGGLVSSEDLKVSTDAYPLSPSGFELLFKKNPMIVDSWAQSFRIGVQSFGAAIIDNGVHTPVREGEDWVFRIEGYNPRYTKVKVYEFDTSKELITFKSLSGETTDNEWTRPTIHTTNVPKVVQLPVTITGIQNVVNFLFGYLDAATEEGWIFNDGGTNTIDAGTGRTRTMQLEIEKYINDCYVGLIPGQASIVNPFIDRANFGQPTGLVSEFTNNALFDVLANPGAFDMLGVKYKVEDLNLIRRNGHTMISANGPLFSLHVQIDEYEHLFVFNYYAQPSDQSGMLYDPFSGSRVMTYRLNGRKQQTKTMRPEFGGHYLVGNEVFQGLQASTDNIQNFYNTNTVFENEKTTRNALALLGFSTKPYFDDLDISSKTQFNFWRGLIQSKGTNMSIDAYLNNNRFDNAEIDEYWAYKVAEYGDARPRVYPELKLNVDDALMQFTQLWFDPSSTDLANIPADMKSFIQITRFDENRWFSIDDLNKDTYFEAMQVGSYVNTVNVGDIITLPFVADRIVGSKDSNFDIINATTIKVTKKPSTDKFTVVGYGASTPKFNPVKLFNYVANELIEEIPYWHPAAGSHTPQAMDSVNVISDYNPARFNTSTLVANSNTYDPLRPWGKNEIGRVWLDTSNLHYVPYYDANVFKTLGERLSRWGTLADYGSVDVYEWVESTVPPDQYNALAKLQAGDANLNPLTKAGGEVGFPMYYTRSRTWQMRPIAWAYSPVPVDVDFENNPPFHGGSSMSGLRLNVGGLAILDNRTFSSLNITAGMRIGAWDEDKINPKPLNEYAITNRFTKFVCDVNGIETDCSTYSGVNQGLSVGMCVTSNDANYNEDLVGQLLIQTPNPIVIATATDTTGKVIARTVETQIKITNIGTGISETVTVNSVVANGTTGPLYGAVIEVAPSQKWVFEFATLGLTISVNAKTSGTYPVDALSKAITSALSNKVWVRDAVVVNPVVSASTDASYLTNDPDQAALLTAYGWRAWAVPTQEDLNSDGAQPVSSWKPYVGDLVVMPGFTNSQLKEAIEYTNNPLTLNSGVAINRYASKWGDWNKLDDVMTQITQTQSDGEVVFTFDKKVVKERTGVFVNGAQLLTAGYEIEGNKITVKYVQKGHTVTVLTRKYLPTQEELAFEPDDMGDDLARQNQYKLDYEYVSQPVRGQDGNIDSYLYYFWVRNKTTAAEGKRMSIQAVMQEMTSGPANYLTFQHMLNAENGLPYRYDAVTISGLSYVVTKDNTFKLRFTRDFTLRDDPQELDLKNVHTEWTLIRPGQRTKIPEALWAKLTDSVAGEDVAGNAVPSIRRVLYDERHNTRTQYGFGVEQTLAPSEILKPSLVQSVLNIQLVNAGGVIPEDIAGLDYDRDDLWFIDSEASRKTMTDIWNNATPGQVNAIFFGVLDDILASNYELTDLFKTSRLSAYSIKVVASTSNQKTSNDNSSNFKKS